MYNHQISGWKETAVKEMMNLVKKFITERRLKVKEERDMQIKRQFEVVERGNILWLTHDGVAFQKIPDGKTATEVAEMLNAARMAATSYVVI